MADAINKPYDRIWKSFADEAPELFLRLMGLLPPNARLEPLRPETAPAVVMPDFAAMAHADDDSRSIVHAEFISHYRGSEPRVMARYGGSLAWHHQVPVNSALVFLRPEGVPADVPQLGEYAVGHTRTRHPYRVVKIWEVDPAPLLATRNPRLLPLAVVMNTTEEQVREIASLVAREGDQEALGRFLILGGTRYDRATLEEMVGGLKMSFERAILENNSIVNAVAEEIAAERVAERLDKAVAQAVQQAVEQAVQQAVEQAVAQAVPQAAAEATAHAEVATFGFAIRTMLHARFPEIESTPELDAITSTEKFKELIATLATAPDANSARAAIVAAAGRTQ